MAKPLVRVIMSLSFHLIGRSRKKRMSAVLLVHRRGYREFEELGTDQKPGAGGGLRVDLEADALTLHHESDDASALAKSADIAHGENAPDADGFQDFGGMAGLS